MWSVIGTWPPEPPSKPRRNRPPRANAASVSIGPACVGWWFYRYNPGRWPRAFYHWMYAGFTGR